MIDNNKKNSDTRVRSPQKPTIAENHLSKHGRFGDTEMYRTSGGELWHVNKEEKNLMDSLGSSGEKLVSLKGSGTRNPTTGLKENFVAALGAVLAIGGGITGAAHARSAGAASREAAQSSLAHLQEAKKLLPESKEKKEGALHLDYQLGTEKISQETGMSVEALNKQTDVAIKKSGFATSGEVEGNRESMWKNLLTGLKGVKRNLLGKYAAGMGEVEGWFKGESARLASEEKTLNAQIKMYDTQANKKFLGIF